VLIISAVNVKGRPGQSQKFRSISLLEFGFNLARHALFIVKGTSSTWQNFKRHPMTMTSLGPLRGSSIASSIRFRPGLGFGHDTPREKADSVNNIDDAAAFARSVFLDMWAGPLVLPLRYRRRRRRNHHYHHYF
ncbi:uncharacterized protein CCOS01_06639, partial [Colletotrichum costaricense]